MLASPSAGVNLYSKLRMELIMGELKKEILLNSSPARNACQPLSVKILLAQLLSYQSYLRVIFSYREFFPCRAYHLERLRKSPLISLKSSKAEADKWPLLSSERVGRGVLAVGSDPQGGRGRGDDDSPGGVMTTLP